MPRLSVGASWMGAARRNPNLFPALQNQICINTSPSGNPQKRFQGDMLLTFDKITFLGILAEKGHCYSWTDLSFTSSLLVQHKNYIHDAIGCEWMLRTELHLNFSAVVGRKKEGWVTINVLRILFQNCSIFRFRPCVRHNCDMSIYANIYRFWALVPVYHDHVWRLKCWKMCMKA